MSLFRLCHVVFDGEPHPTNGERVLDERVATRVEFAPPRRRIPARDRRRSSATSSTVAGEIAIRSIEIWGSAGPLPLYFVELTPRIC